MKSFATTSTWHQQHPNAIRLRPIVLPSPPVKLANGSSLKMKSSRTKRLSPKQPLPSISTLFDSSSTTSSATSSYGSYCQFSPEGTYTMYNMPYHTPTTLYQEMITPTAPMGQQTATQTAPDDEVHTPFNQPLFIQTSDFNSQSSPAYPTTSTINANQLLLRPVPTGNC